MACAELFGYREAWKKRRCISSFTVKFQGSKVSLQNALLMFQSSSENSTLQ